MFVTHAWLDVGGHGAASDTWGITKPLVSAVEAMSLVSLDVCAVVLEHAPLGLQTKERLQLGYLAVCADLCAGQNGILLHRP